MCTVISHCMKGHPKTAKEDIEVYKYGKTDKDIMVSPFQRFIYEKGVKYEEEFSYTKEQGYFDMKERGYCRSLKYSHYVLGGFHALTELDNFRLSDYSNNEARGKFIIPKGAKYYVNPAKCIVSNQIIFKEII